MKIKSIHAREILDSRGIPTVSTIVELQSGVRAKGEVPSGASTGESEVLELRDGDKARYFGKGVLKAVENVNSEIAKALVGKEFTTQVEFDNFLINLDGTPQKSKLGGNSILSVSMAFCRATALEKNIELYDYFAQIYWGEKYDKSLLKLPSPMILIMEGGAHGNWCTDFQEYMVIPRAEKFATFSEKLRAGAEIFKALHDILVDKGYSATVGFEGAFAPTQMRSNKESFDLIMEAIIKAGYTPGNDILLAIDAAASEFYNADKRTYELKRENLNLEVDQWIELQAKWYKEYPIYSIEDTMAEEDWDGWKLLTAKLGKQMQLVGDDLLTTNVKRIQKAISSGIANSVLIKLNQIGTVTETINAIRMAEMAGYTAVISHRGGETNDDMIADLVVGTYADQSKFGGPDRGERLAKYNRLMEIEEQLVS